MKVTADRWRRLYLVGFMAVGKTTIGRQLARQLGCTFVDLDREITLAEEMTVPEIFALRGEAHFRQLERRYLRETFDRDEVVVATGGGVYTNQGVVDEIRQHGVALWLDLPIGEVIIRLERSVQERPLARDEAQTRALYQDRVPFYEQADLRVPLSLSDSAASLARRIGSRVVRLRMQAESEDSAEDRGGTSPCGS